jgi:hypothetical protein
LLSLQTVGVARRAEGQVIQRNARCQVAGLNWLRLVFVAPVTSVFIVALYVAGLAFDLALPAMIQWKTVLAQLSWLPSTIGMTVLALKPK